MNGWIWEKRIQKKDYVNIMNGMDKQTGRQEGRQQRIIH